MRRIVLPIVLAASCGEAGAPGGDAAAPLPVPPPAESATPAATPPRPEGDPFAGFTLLRDVRLDSELPWKHAGTAADPVPVTLDFLGAWEFDENRQPPFPAAVQALDGRKVVLRGFMLPSIDFRDIREFHLVRSLWGCCFGAPPRLNEIVRVTLPRGVDYTYDGLEVAGTLRVVYENEDGIALDLYRLEADALRELDRLEDPDAPASFDPATARGILLGKQEGS